MMDDKNNPAYEEAGFSGRSIFDINHQTGEISQYAYLKSPNFDSPWKKVNPLFEAAPFFTNLAVIIFLIRIFFLLFSLVRLPRFLAEIVGALVLGTSVFGTQDWTSIFLRPPAHTQAIETMGEIGLTYYMFFVGLEMDLTSLRNLEKKVMCNVAAGIVFSLVAGTGLYFLIIHFTHGQISAHTLGPLFFGACLTVTSFPDLARILSDLKILYTNVGRMALSSAFLNDLASWVFVILTIGFSNGQGSGPFISVAATIIFLFICWFGIRPILKSIIPSIHSGDNYSDAYLYCIFFGVLVFGFIGDACGTHSMVGGFTFGLIMPPGELQTKITRQLEEFATGILLPFYFVTVAMRSNFEYLPLEILDLVVVVVLACSVKVVITFIVSLFCGMSLREGLTLGILMNTKGILSLIMLNIGREKALHFQIYLIMMIILMAMTLMVKPLPYLIYCNRANDFKEHNQRTIENIIDHADFRVLLCIHDLHSIAGLTNLLEYSNSSKQSPIIVFAVHLVELTGRTTAMMIVHDKTLTSTDKDHRPSYDKKNVDPVIKTLEEFEKRGLVESVLPLTVVSPYDTMHEDICNLAQDKLTSLILIPFNKPSRSNGIHCVHNHKFSSIQKVIQNLLKKAPCSVGILIDRGIGLATLMHDGIDYQRQQLRVVMLFCGGPDNREALAYSYRMAGCPNVNLTVIRLVPGRGAEDMIGDVKDFEMEQSIDDEYVNEFKFRTMCDSSIVYGEKVVDNAEELMKVIANVFDDFSFNLCIVGKGENLITPFSEGLSEWMECEELGALGDYLSMSSFAQSASILVIKKYKAH
ncbi:hypothetical protein Tsubulata_031011 [Turnera subulata]|uniref:Cation/H+ exchanger domain-containing protein n=1 Tax=Turnera subulata TaxID=218843 RepID=A0A9Q0FHU5_9ROSI|nr:hypothetical protein Tsubulata_031011 [Turnera subulata]